MNKIIFVFAFILIACNFNPQPVGFRKGVVTSSTGWVPGTNVAFKHFGVVVDTTGDGVGDIWCKGGVLRDTILPGCEVDVLLYEDVEPKAFRRQ